MPQMCQTNLPKLQSLMVCFLKKSMFEKKLVQSSFLPNVGIFFPNRRTFSWTTTMLLAVGVHVASNTRYGRILSQDVLKYRTHRDIILLGS